MANLETLELRINANAKDASEGLRGLISTLSSLSDALVKPYADLRDFNEELQKLKRLGKIKLSIEGTQTYKTVEKTTKAIEKQAKKIKDVYDPATAGNRAAVNQAGQYVPDEEWKRQYEERTALWKKQNADYKAACQEAARIRAEDSKSEADAARAAMEAAESRGRSALSILSTADKVTLLRTQLMGMVNAYYDAAKSGKVATGELAKQALKINELKDKIANLTKRVKAIDAIKSAFKNLTSGIANAFNRIKKIAITMLIRKALRSLVAGMKEGMTNLYNWSKATNGAFGTAMDKAKDKILTLKNSLGAALSPVVQALIPVFNSLASAIINVANWINQFISLLSGKTSWTKAVDGATAGTDALGDSAQGAGSKVKELLASFDELNVIASESGGGGNGITDSTDDYSNMFVEISKFDEKLRSIAEFVKENLESVKDMAIAAGVAILAWKLSNSFSESLATLSKVLGSLAVGAAIAITLQLTWMLDNKYLDTGEDGWLYANILTTAVGTTVAWSLAKKLFSGKAASWVAAMTLTFSAVTDIVANVQHTDVDALSAESLKLDIVAALKAGAAAGIILSTATSLSFPYVLLAAGGVALLTFGVSMALKLLTQKDDIEVDDNLIHLSQEQLDEFVRYKMFTIDPKVMVSVTEDSIQSLNLEQEKVETKLLGMIGTLNVVKLGIAEKEDYATLKEQITGEGGLIDTVSGWINEANNVNKLVLKFTPKIVGSTPEEQQSWYLEATEGWKFVEEHMQGLGKELANLVVKGENDQLIVKRPERVAAILDEIARISEIVAGSDAMTEAQIDLGIKLNDLDSSGVSEAINKYSEYKAEIAKAAKELQETAYANQQRLVNALTVMLEIDPDNQELKNKLAEAQAGLDQITQEMKQGLNESIDEMLEPGRNMLQDWLDMNFDPGSISIDWSKKRLESYLNTEGFESTVKEILKKNNIDVDVDDFFEVGGWNLLTEDLQSNLISSIVMTPETAEVLKNSIGLDASAIFYYTNWDDLKTRQKWALLDSLKEVYGANDVIAAAQDAGIDIAKFIADGMANGTPEVKKKAQEWNAILANYMKPEVKPTADSSKVKTLGTNMSTWLLSKFPLKRTITAVGDKKSATNAGNTINKYTKVETKKTITVLASKPSIQQIKKDIDSGIGGQRVVDIKANVLDNIVPDIAEKFKNGIVRGFAGAKLKFGPDGKVSFNANGGLVHSGDIFVANENGKSEMIGRFGNQTGVANQEQMVEAMARGVQYANSEQNALLREQNNLLRGILQKEGTVRIGASSALGRVAKQSLEMYGNMVGG